MAAVAGAPEVAYTVDTTDPAKEAAYLRFTSEIGPQRDEARVRLAAASTSATRGRTWRRPCATFRNARDLFRVANVPLAAEVEALNSDYQKLTGAMTVEWAGEEKTVAQLLPFLEDPDRDVRERAFRELAAPYIAARNELADLFSHQFALRERMAKNVGFTNFRDCARFAAAVDRRLARRRRLMGLAAPLGAALAIGQDDRGDGRAVLGVGGRHRRGHRPPDARRRPGASASRMAWLAPFEMVGYIGRAAPTSSVARTNDQRGSGSRSQRGYS